MRERWARRDPNPTALRLVGVYGVLAAVATSLAFGLRDGPPWICPEPWFVMTPIAALSSSVALGIGLAMAIVVSTRVAVSRLVWAKRLHSDLRPVAQDLRLAHIVAVAGLSSLGEELFFRGLLVPTLGVLASSVLFGLAHQVRGPSRWIWATWATAVGGGLGAIFMATGSLVGPLLAHAVINGANLVYLRDHDPAFVEPGGE
jgi:membrane protease YdiL (CAAX protease family)